MPINPIDGSRTLAEVRLIEQRTSGDTIYTTVERCYNDANGVCVARAVDPPQAQLDANQWPEIKAARDTLLALVEQAAAWELNHLGDPGQTYIPRQPTIVSAEASSTSATLTWQAVRGATGYKSYRSIDGGATWSPAVSHTVDDLDRAYSNLTPGQTYRLAVVAVGSGGESAKAWVDVTVPEAVAQ